MVGGAAMARSGATAPVPAALTVALTGALTVVLGCCALALGRAAFLEAAGLWAHRDDLRFDDLVLAGALGVLAVASGWLLLGIMLTLSTRALRCSHTLAGRMARAITPSLVRSLLGGACGAAVLVAPTTAPGALAVPAETGRPQTQECPRRSCSDVLGGLPVPDRPWSAREAPPTIRAQPERVRVRPGDSLWAIAAAHLPTPALTTRHNGAERVPDRLPAHRLPPPSQAEIAAAWPRWFDVNRARIGDDPDLISPGTRLVVPRRFR
ncbi:MAG TPA: LysM peptidoglycan-binding domain-containing protein [Nocardioidaceae bacterium]|nr:LysM peptidoglycan-binding domain-containing protein [Nocardioidaceae bacterium]